MQVYKFGGASLKDADAVRNVVSILEKNADNRMVVVLSAMGNTTGSLEKVLTDWYDDLRESSPTLENIRYYHREIMSGLFPDRNHPVYDSVDALFEELQQYLSNRPRYSFDQEYDQVVSYGEILSSVIVYNYLITAGLPGVITDVRNLICTDSTFRDAKVDWKQTTANIQELCNNYFEDPGTQFVLTQGFLGRDPDNFTTTLGRDGSDYTAAIFSYALNAEEMVIWKDVPGLLNADPRYFSKTQLLKVISYREAIELAYYGATIIHPKTIKPLQNKSIPLKVKSFINPKAKGSVIHDDAAFDRVIPSFIFKVNQALISISPKDFSFVDEQNLSNILSIFADNHIHIRLMQNSAISFTVCVDNNERRLESLFGELRKEFNVRYNSGLELITIRHYDQPTIDRVLEEDKTVLLEMRTRQTAQFVVKPGILYW